MARSAVVEVSRRPNKCKDCQFDLRRSRSVYCHKCEEIFDADDQPSTVVCPCCKGSSVSVIKDHTDQYRPMDQCKLCLRKAVPALRKVAPIDRAAEPDQLPPPPADPSGGSMPAKPRDASTPIGPTVKQPGPAGGVKIQDSTVDSASSGSDPQNNLNELWRFLGCVCGNQEPECFQLVKSMWPKTSNYCLDCKQPYSAFMWSNELPKDQCPRCNGARIEVDKIQEGDDVIKCLQCDCMVSKLRFDTVCQEVQQQCDAEKRNAKKASAQTSGCLHCGSTEVQLAVINCEDNPCVMQICNRCDSMDFLAGWDRTSGRIGVREADETNVPREGDQPPATPDGFEELTRCCGAGLASLHPVENDPNDELLVCAHCNNILSLRACKSKVIPMTVTALRKTLKGTFSSGKMGRPYRTVKVASLAELKPADQLDLSRKWFGKPLYSHHAIVEKPVVKAEALEVIEYTVDVNVPTVLDFFRFRLPRVSVRQSMLKFRDIMQSMYKVDYHSLDCFHPDAVISRAVQRMGENKYNVIGWNCEHFSNWAKANVSFSRQVEYFKETAKSALRSAVVEISDYLDDLPQEDSVRHAVTILQDIRAEMLRVLEAKKEGSPSIRDFWCPIRLVVKWAIRGIPLAFSKILSKTASCKLMWNLDGLLAPLSLVAGEILSVGNGKDEGDEKKK